MIPIIMIPINEFSPGQDYSLFETERERARPLAARLV